MKSKNIKKKNEEHTQNHVLTKKKCMKIQRTLALSSSQTGIFTSKSKTDRLNVAHFTVFVRS